MAKRNRKGPRPLTPAERALVDRVLRKLPYYRPFLRILAADGLAEKRRRLVVEEDGGASLHAASFVPRRRLILDQNLFRNRRELARILYHELFHFVWARLGNSLRFSYEELLRREWAARARGEMGWPAEAQKLGLPPARKPWSRRWRKKWASYVCESFCDSAAWLCLAGQGRAAAHPEWTLKPRFRDRRRRWFLAADVLPRLRL